jgi:hypothetical protein
MRNRPSEAIFNSIRVIACSCDSTSLRRNTESKIASLRLFRTEARDWRPPCHGRDARDARVTSCHVEAGCHTETCGHRQPSRHRSGSTPTCGTRRRRNSRESHKNPGRRGVPLCPGLGCEAAIPAKTVKLAVHRALPTFAMLLAFCRATMTYDEAFSAAFWHEVCSVYKRSGVQLDYLNRNERRCNHGIANTCESRPGI